MVYESVRESVRESVKGSARESICQSEILFTTLSSWRIRVKYAYPLPSLSKFETDTNLDHNLKRESWSFFGRIDRNGDHDGTFQHLSLKPLDSSMVVQIEDLLKITLKFKL